MSDIKTALISELSRTAPQILSSLTAGRTPAELLGETEELAQLHARALFAARSGDHSEILLCRELIRKAEIRADAALAKLTIESNRERRQDMLFALGTAALRVALVASGV